MDMLINREMKPLKFILPALLSLGIFSTLSYGKNVLLILSDDHRYDFMSFMEETPEFLETPNLDRIAKEGAH